MSNNVIILAPHPDDGEFGAGATINKLVEEGNNVFYFAFSPCKISLAKSYNDNILFKELFNAAKYLGIKKENIFTFDFPVREFYKYRQDILEELIKIKKTLNPDIVILPNSNDIHQDHQVMYNEGIRAFKHNKIIGYELPWNSFSFKNNFYVKIEERHLNAKWNAICQYKSQNHRFYKKKDFFIGLARLRGTQINYNFAETFELIRWWI